MLRSLILEIQIKYQSKIKDANIINPNREKDFIKLGELEDKEAKLSTFFNKPMTDLVLIDKGIKFEYDSINEQLYCIAIYTTNTKPNNQQITRLIRETTEQLDRGFYGEDGWFVDIEENSYYIDLIDHNRVDSQPHSVSYIDIE